MRKGFAVPFVLVVSAGCPGRTYRNPPPPRTIPATECRAITAGSPCQGMRDANDNRDPHFCSIDPPDTTCGMQGFECRATEANKFEWKELTLKPCDGATPAEPPAEPPTE